MTIAYPDDEMTGLILELDLHNAREARELLAIAPRPAFDEEEDGGPACVLTTTPDSTVTWVSMPPSMPASTPPRGRKPKAVRTPDAPAATALLPNTVPPWPEIAATDATKFDHPLGFELTMIPPVLNGKGGGDDSSIVRAYATIVEHLMDREKVGYYRDPHRDQFAVEVPSKPMKTWGEYKKWYDTVTGMMRSVGLMPHHEKVTSGGGHIHVGSLKAPTMVNMMRDMANKPWLMWTFNEPDDDTSACNFADLLGDVSDSLRDMAVRANFNPAEFCDEMSEEGQTALLFYGNPDYLSTRNLPDDKGRVCRYKSTTSTFEFRMFEAPADWGEQRAQIKFVEAYIRWVDKEYKSKRAVAEINRMVQLTAMQKPECEVLFRNFLTTLGLPHAPYERMIRENLGYRFARGNRV